MKLNPGHQHAVVHFALDQIPDTIQKIAITMVIDGSDTISGLAQLKLSAESQSTFCRSQWPHRKGCNYGEVYRYRATGSSGRLGRDLMAGLSHWQLAMVWTWNLQQKLYRNQPISLEKKLKVKRLRLSARLRKPVFHWQNTNWIPLKHESLLFSMPQAL